ncbi:unnamed protein product, partial [Rotaria magnacalcarata]
MKIDRSKLQDDLILKMYQKELVTTYEESNQSSLDVNNKYIEFVKYVRQATQKHLTKKADKNKKRKEWMTDEIMNKVDEKSAAYVKWQNHRGTADEDKYKGKYTVLRKVVKNMINERQIEYWNKVSSEIETAITQHDPATAYAIIRRFKSGKQDVQNMSVKKKGTMLLRSDEKLERWREHFEELLVNVNSAVGTHTIDSISIPNISTLEIQRQDKIPTLEEIQLALSQMKSKKAPGNDGIIVDILKAGGTPGLIWLKELSVEIWENERIPENWSSAILIPLFKNKGDKTSCDNYRGICLLNVVSKLLTRVILNRIQIMIDQQLLEQQVGFRSNRSTVDQIFIVNMIMEKASEYDIPLFICFIDIQKAYDSVNRELLWKICSHYGLTDKIVKSLQLVYKDSNARVKINGDLSECFKMHTGVMQGGIPSPFLFNIVFDFIMKKVLSETKIAGVQLSY